MRNLRSSSNCYVIYNQSLIKAHKNSFHYAVTNDVNLTFFIPLETPTYRQNLRSYRQIIIKRSCGVENLIQFSFCTSSFSLNQSHRTLRI